MNNNDFKEMEEAITDAPDIEALFNLLRDHPEWLAEMVARAKKFDMFEFVPVYGSFRLQFRNHAHLLTVDDSRELSLVYPNRGDSGAKLLCDGKVVDSVFI